MHYGYRDDGTAEDDRDGDIDGDDDDDDDDDGDGDVDDVDGTHPYHQYTYHPFHPSRLHPAWLRSSRCLPRGLLFLPFCSTSFPSPSLPLPVVHD